MSRVFLLLALLFTLLSLTVASKLHTEHSVELSAPTTLVAPPTAACLNNCSMHGICISTSEATACACQAGYVGVDCSVMATMKPMCWLEDNICSYWQIQGDYLYQRVTSTVTKGWAAVMWGSTDGMSHGQSTIVSIPTPYLPTVIEGYNMKKGKPNTTALSIPQANVTGYVNGSYMDVSFQRKLDTGLPEHFVIPSKTGTITNMSVAYGSKYFEFHGDNATFFKIDIAAAAAGTWTGEEEVQESSISKLWRAIRGQ